ncbi:MAG: hypothetical protein KDA91_07270 [Planctomycetaceae bacterium]|nr:hypothetical protein [Planctomycetaceae bacterium]
MGNSDVAGVYEGAENGEETGNGEGAGKVGSQTSERVLEGRHVSACLE